MVNITHGVTLKGQQELEKMKAGGRLLAQIKEQLKKAVVIGGRASAVEQLAGELIARTGGKASFKMVPGYYWNTCINVNAGLVHGIPRQNVIFKRGDLVSVDIGLFYQGLHTDSSFSLALEPESKVRDFLRVGELAMKKSIAAVRVGGRISDISAAIETTVTKAGYAPIRALVGHGVGRALHEEPAIPCFTAGKPAASPEIKVGMTLAIEVMYALGRPEVQLAEDGWTITSLDGKMTALFEETVAATKRGPLVLTAI